MHNHHGLGDIFINLVLLILLRELRDHATIRWENTFNVETSIMVSKEQLVHLSRHIYLQVLYNVKE